MILNSLNAKLYYTFFLFAAIKTKKRHRFQRFYGFSRIKSVKIHEICKKKCLKFYRIKMFFYAN